VNATASVAYLRRRAPHQGSPARHRPVRCAAFDCTPNGNRRFDIAHPWDKWILAFGIDELYGRTNNSAN
jgi:hypothetical protein